MVLGGGVCSKIAKLWGLEGPNMNLFFQMVELEAQIKLIRHRSARRKKRCHNVLTTCLLNNAEVLPWISMQQDAGSILYSLEINGYESVYLQNDMINTFVERCAISKSSKMSLTPW